MQAVEIAAAVRSGQVRAIDLAETCLARLAQGDPFAAVTRVLAERARDEAGRVGTL